MATKKKSREQVMTVGEFKANCLAILDEVEARRHTFVITKRGRAVARIVPFTINAAGALRGSLLREEGLLDPIDGEWDACS